MLPNPQTNPKTPEFLFREAADNDKTKEMIDLYNAGGIGVDAIGIGTGRAAAHWAAEKGHTQVLQLLFNLGAKFDFNDKKDQKTPKELALKAETKLQFELIEVAQKALIARKLFFPKTNQECTGEERTAFDVFQKDLEDFRNSFTPSQIEKYHETLYWSYREDASKGEPSRISIKQQDMDDINEQLDKAALELANYAAYPHTFLRAINNNIFVAACGEAAVTSYYYLLGQVKDKFPVAIINVTDKLQPLAGHAVLVVNFDPRYEAHDVKGWAKALIIDPYKEYIFFYAFKEQYPKDSCIKIIKNWNIECLCSNVTPQFSTKLKLPKTQQKYKELHELIDTQAIQLIQKRLPPPETDLVSRLSVTFNKS